MRQITANADRELIRAYCLAWAQTHRVSLPSKIAPDQLAKLNNHYEEILTGTYRATSRTLFISMIKDLRVELLIAQRQAISALMVAAGPRTLQLKKLVQNPVMEKIIQRRMIEIVEIIDRAPLAAAILMGALLEALFLARINLHKDKAELFSLKATPKDKSGKAKELKDWGLNDFIEVAHEIGWIRKALRDIGVVLRDYRNIIHPVKELALQNAQSTSVLVSIEDARMMWRIFCEVSEQIENSAL